MIADYTYYTETYKGSSIPEADFPRLITRAGSYLDQITGGRASSAAGSAPVKMAACAVAEAWQTNEQGGDVVSETVSSWTKTFAGGGTRGPQARLYQAAALYLVNTGLLFRGVCR